jgi:hypothetical protein
MDKRSEVSNQPLPVAASSIAAGFGLGPIDQISFAVTGVEQSLPWYEAVFGGPFTVREVTLAPGAVTYRGAPADASGRCLVLAQ